MKIDFFMSGCILSPPHGCVSQTYKIILQCEIEWMKNIHVSASELHGLCLCMACLVNYLWRHLSMQLVSNLNNFIALVTHYVKWARTCKRIMPPSLIPSCHYVVIYFFLPYTHHLCSRYMSLLITSLLLFLWEGLFENFRCL